VNYAKWIQDKLKIVNKERQEVPFILNNIQQRYIAQEMTGNDVILKARQQGFSSVILGMFCADFILMENTYNVVVADIDDNAEDLLHRVKKYIQYYEEITGKKVPLKYNSKTELYNEAMNSRYKIGTAKNTEFGRSKTISNLHLSEFAFYSDPERLFASAVQAVVPTGRTIIETTANGFNYFKSFWDECKNGTKPYKALFYKASDFYDSQFLGIKKQQLGRLFQQEYPETDIEAFLTSGDCYFNTDSLQWYLKQFRNPIEGGIYV
jgi:hypothetical protein